MIKGRIYRSLVYVINIPLYYISYFFPKNKNVWIFGAWFGDKYSDNSRYLFEHINKNHPDIRAIWITDNLDVIDRLNKERYEVYKKYSIKSILLGLKAKYSVFVQSNSVDCMPFLNNNKTFNIQLWHGSPLKKIGFDDNLLEHNKGRILKIYLFPFLIEKYDLIISSSKEDKDKFQTAFNNNKIKILGYPRNDLLINKKNSMQFIVTYLPTFRDSIGDKIDLFTHYNFDIGKWNKELINSNIILNIKMHPVNKPKDEILERFKDCKNINFLEEIDVARILPNTNILITDYSSVYFDYLLTNRPIIFAPYDYKEYITKDRELYYEYNQVTPGPKCKNWDEVLDWIVMFKDDSTLYVKEREEVKNRFHKYQDGKSCERVYQNIIALDTNGK